MYFPPLTSGQNRFSPVSAPRFQGQKCLPLPWRSFTKTQVATYPQINSTVCALGEEIQLFLRSSRVQYSEAETWANNKLIPYIYGLRVLQRYEDAHRVLQQFQRLHDRQHPGDNHFLEWSFLLAMAANLEGLVYFDEGKYEKALDTFEQASGLLMSYPLAPRLTSIVLHNIGTTRYILNLQTGQIVPRLMDWSKDKQMLGLALRSKSTAGIGNMDELIMSRTVTARHLEMSHARPILDFELSKIKTAQKKALRAVAHHEIVLMPLGD